jgi:hypothetical protein
MTNKQFIYSRYSSLVDTWSHQNTMQLQWPSMAITTVLIVLSILVSNQLDKFLNITFWGQNRTVIIGGGIPLLLLGLGTCTMLYLMGRAQRVMRLIEEEITKIESEFEIDGKNFSLLNHPKGISGAKMVRLYLTACIAFPITFTGFLMTFGITIGIIFCVSFASLSLYIELAQRERKKNSY